MAGKRSIYNEKWLDKIVDKILEGHSIVQIGSLKGFPTARTLFRWLHTYPELREAVNLAKEFAAEGIYDECEDIADKVTEEAAAVSKASLRVKTRLARIGRNAPRSNTTVNVNNTNTAQAAAQATSEATAMNIELNWTQKPYSQWTPEDLKQYEYNRLAMLHDDDLLSPEELAEELTYTFRIENNELKKVKKQC